MKIVDHPLPGAYVLEPKVFTDDRGFFLESYNHQVFRELGIEESFVQDNHSRSQRGVLRGLHYQIARPQGKLVRVISGEVRDVFVDLRRSSPTFGHWHGVNLSQQNHLLVWIPVGFAHGFSVLSESADVVYKTTELYAPEFERTLLWNDPELNIDWQLQSPPLLSDKDRHGLRLSAAPAFP